jgi:arylsulfatase A-like enzyme
MSQQPERRGPNVVMIVADQLRADAVGGFGAEFAHTPNIDALAQRGTRFENCFVQHTVCGPSRASFLTGWYPHVRGHRSLTHLLRPEDPNLLKTFKQNGYHVTHVGERGDTWAPGGTEASCDEYGWTVPPTTPMTGRKGAMHPDWPMSRAFYIGKIDDEFDDDFDEACTTTAETWLAQRPTDRPWMLYVPMVFPHCPFAVTEPWYSLHDRDALPARRPHVQSGREPDFMAHLRTTYGTDRLSDADWREIAGVYHGMVSRLDAQIGRILAALGDDLDDTLVVFCSDHGEYLGDYDLIEKWPSGLHDCLARDPLILAGPGIPNGGVIDQMVELIDLVPTLHELTGIEADYTHFGRSLLPVLADPSAPHREFAFTEGGFLAEEEHLFESPPFPYDRKGVAEHERPETVGKAVAIRSADWTYVWRLYEPPELYDRRNDPGELHNLAGQPEHGELEARLSGELLRWMVATGDVMPWEEDPRIPDIDLPVPAAGADLAG